MTVGAAGATRGRGCPDALRLPGARYRTGGPARPGRGPHPAVCLAGHGRGDRPLAGPLAWPGDNRDGGRLDGGHGRHVGHGRRCHGRLCPAVPPYPARHDHLVLLSVGRHPAPGGRLADIAHLGNDQFRQALAFQDRPGSQPGEDAGWQDIQPEQGVTEGEPEQREEDHIRHGDGGENGNLAHRKGHREPEIVELVQPFLDPPDAGVGGQLHRSSLPSAGWSGGQPPTPKAFAMP